MDIIGAALSGAAYRTAWAPAAAFAAGAATCVGPCVAPRFIAVVALTGDASGRARLSRLAGFVGGLVMSTVATALSVSLLLRVARHSSLIYALLACGLGAYGLRTLFVGHNATCAHARSPRDVSLGASFALGASFGVVLSPCCTPLTIALASLMAGHLDPAFSVLVVASFAFGHALPLLAIAFGSQKLQHLVSGPTLSEHIGTIGGTLMIALGAYYAVLA